jgi:hypothetical protein
MALPNARGAPQASPGARRTVRIVAATSVTTSCSIDHTRSARAVISSAVRLRLRVIFTTTIELDSATAQTQRDRAQHAAAERDERRRAGDRHERHLRGDRDEDPEGLAPQRAKVELDPDLEQQQDDADIDEDLYLMAVGHISRRERTDRETNEEIADDRR